MKPPRAPALTSAPRADSTTVLIAVLGSSPAVLTETLWALAHESDPVIPDHVIVITTTRGKLILDSQLLQQPVGSRELTIWQALRTRVLGKGARRDPRLNLNPTILVSTPDPASGISRELDDIRSPADNQAAAETILAAVRRFTTDPESRVIGLLAGGRKTMGALLHAALSLAGRPGDRLLHVLVNEPFDDPRLEPPFFFPGQPGPAAHKHSCGRSFAQADARIEIADVPLVALGELVATKTGQAPATFAALARAANVALADATASQLELRVGYDPRTRRLQVNRYACTLPTGRAAAFCEALINDAHADLDLVDRTALEARWSATDPRTGKAQVTYPKPGNRPMAFTSDDISNALNVVRNELRAAGAPQSVVDRVFPRRAPIGLTRERVFVLK
jgi:CRISPR-associated protein (TIGR02584 family)